tara:strand:+ start:1653 stop:2303 length:651 start_codon:yes stop_codon:yes gene_type:complete
MTLQSSGAISLSQIQSEWGGSSPISLSEYYRNSLPSGRTNYGSIPTSGAISMSNFFGTNSAVASITIATGNSFYQAATQYVAAKHNLNVVGANFQTGYASAPNFTQNGRTTRFWGIVFSPVNNRYSFTLLDISGGGGSITRSYNGHPQNTGWTTMVLTGNGSSRTFTRSSATFSTANAMGINNVYYSGANWLMPAGISNIFPNSNNTTSFTVVLTP